MAYFECVIGSAASGGSGADLIVSCTSGFAGSVITCTNGTDTFTQTCPSTSPYEVTFESIPTGTWTISGVSGGQTFTQSVTITDFTASLNDIPDGSTVTPVNDIQIWLHCANIWDKTYTTIAQVLSDTSTLLALISSNNAVDYMARSTSWASSVCANQTAMGYIGNNNYCADALLSDSTWCTAICNSTYFESVLNVKVPTMTSNTTPSGEVLFDTNKTGGGSPATDYYTLFNGDTTSVVGTSSATSEQYFGYDFTDNNINGVCKVSIYGHYAGGTIDIDIQGSDNKTSEYSTVKSFIYTSSQAWQEFIIPLSSKHRFWRLYCTKGSTASIAFRTLQFYGRKNV